MANGWEWKKREGDTEREREKGTWVNSGGVCAILGVRICAKVLEQPSAE